MMMMMIPQHKKELHVNGAVVTVVTILNFFCSTLKLRLPNDCVRGGQVQVNKLARIDHAVVK